MRFSSDYYTAGELAQLTGITKQLLIYYDKNNIFSPAFTAENGYRYYSLHQYYILEILITLRKMGLSLKEIRQYIDNRGVENLSQLYRSKIEEYAETIADLQRKSSSLQKRVEHLDSLKETRINEFLLYRTSGNTRFVSVEIPMKWHVKKRVTEIAEYMLPYLKDEKLLEDNIAGVSLPKEALTRNPEYKLPKYSILIDYNSAKLGNYAKESIVTLRKGLYLTVNIPSHFGVITKEHKGRILDFLEKNSLQAAGDIFCFPLTNYWMTMPGENEISKVVINVKHKK